VWIGCIAALAFTRCKTKDKDPGPASVMLSFQHTVQGVPLKLGSYLALNDSEQVRVERLKYYLSNFTFRSGTRVSSEKDSYHLVMTGANGLATTVVKNIASGEYSSLDFYFGIDSVKNSTVDYTGDLDPSLGMAWDWVTGYKFFLMEGKAKNTLREQALVWHIGQNENYRRISRTFPTTTVKEGDTLKLTFVCALDSLFLKPNNFLPLATHHDVMDSRDTATMVANNFAAAFIKVK